MTADTKIDILGKMQPSEIFEQDQQWEPDFMEILSSVAREVSSVSRESAVERPEANRSATVYMPQTAFPTKARAVQFKVAGAFGVADPLREKETDAPQSIGKPSPAPADTRAYSVQRLAVGLSHEGLAIVPLGGTRQTYRRMFGNLDFLTALSEAQAAAIAHKQPVNPTPADRARFRKLATQWARDTEGMSVHSRAVMHRAYQQIIGMGAVAIPLLLEALRDQPDHWMWALSVLSDEDPARNARTFMQARAAWLRWGDEKGYIGD